MSTCNPPDSAGFKAWFKTSGFDDEAVRAARCGWNAAMKHLPRNGEAHLDHSALYNAQGRERKQARHAYFSAWDVATHRMQLAAPKPKKTPASILEVATDDANIQVMASTHPLQGNERKAFVAGFVDARLGKQRGHERWESQTIYLNGYAEGNLVPGRKRAVGPRPPRIPKAKKVSLATAMKQHDIRRAAAHAAMAKDPRHRAEMFSAARQQIWAIAESDERAGDKHALDTVEAARRLRSIVNDDVETLGGHVAAVKLYLAERKLVRSRIREEKKSEPRAVTISVGPKGPARVRATAPLAERQARMVAGMDKLREKAERKAARIGEVPPRVATRTATTRRVVLGKLVKV